MRYLLLALLCGCAVETAEEIAPSDDHPEPTLPDRHRPLPVHEDPTRPEVTTPATPPCTLPCVEEPPTLTDVLDGSTWRLESEAGDDVWVTFSRDGEQQGTALYEPVAGDAFPCAGEGTFSVVPSSFAEVALILGFPEGCGGTFIEVASFADASFGGLLSQVTPMHGTKQSP